MPLDRTTATTAATTTEAGFLARAVRRYAAATLTAASRITVPTYPAVYGVVGLLFLLQEPSRTSGDAFDVARMIAPIYLWGIWFLAVAVLEAISVVMMASPHRDIAERGRLSYIRLLRVGAGLAAFWAVVLFAAARDSDQVSYTSGVWLAAIVLFHIASGRSLAFAEGRRLP